MSKSNKSAVKVIEHVEQPIVEQSMNTTEQQVVIDEVVEPVVVVEHVRPAKDEKGRYKTVDMSYEEIEKAIGKANKSQTIRYLIGQNYSPSSVAKFLGIIYQHVNNVMRQELKKPAK